MAVIADPSPRLGNASIAGVAALGPFVVTPSDTDELPVVVIALRAPSDGVIVVVPVKPVGTQIDVAHDVKAGEIIRGFFKQVRVNNAANNATTTVTGNIIGYV